MFYRLLLFFVLSTYAAEKSICLNMIVKNEEKVIQRCLESVKEHIDYWVIVDTGSTDGTKEVIRQVLSDIPGDLYEREWVDFAHNRNEALDLAKDKGDYLLLVDADEELKLDAMPSLSAQGYYVTVRESLADYLRYFLIDSKLNWRWEGVLHETLLCSEVKREEILTGALLISKTEEGARSKDPEKYLKDAHVLEEALLKDPKNSRYVFYLAQSYQNANNLPKALEQYEKRGQMGGWDQEVFWSFYQSALLKRELNEKPEVVIAALKKAFQYRPSRAEPLFHLANLYLNLGDPFLAYATAKLGASIQISKDHVFVERAIYQFGLLETLAHAAFELRFYLEAQKLCEKLLSQESLPPLLRASIEKNLNLLESLIQ